MKSSNDSFETPKEYLSFSMRLGNHFSPTGKSDLFLLGKCRIVPKNDCTKKQNSDIVCLFTENTKNNHFEKLHNAENCRRVLFENLVCFKILQNLKGVSLETLKNFRKENEK